MKRLIVMLMCAAVLSGCASPRPLEIGGHCLRCHQEAERWQMHTDEYQGLPVEALCSRCWRQATLIERAAYCQRVIDFYRRNYPSTINPQIP